MKLVQNISKATRIHSRIECSHKCLNKRTHCIFVVKGILWVLMIHKLLMFVLKRYNLQFSRTGISLITHSCPREEIKSLMLFAELFISVPP